MNDLEVGPEERSLIAAAKITHIPNEVQRARVRRGLDAKLAAGVAAPLLAGSTALAMTGKVGIAIALVAAVGTGTAYFVSARPAPRALPAPIHHAVAPTAPVATPAPTPASVDSPRENAIPASAQPRSLVRQQKANPPPPADLGGELALLTQVSAATKRRDITQANELLRAYDLRFPSGKLAEERAAAGILVLCAAGHTQTARAEAKRFIERWPRSPLVARIHSSCASEVQTP
jgi:hypothetical protein